MRVEGCGLGLGLGCAGVARGRAEGEVGTHGGGAGAGAGGRGGSIGRPGGRDEFGGAPHVRESKTLALAQTVTPSGWMGAAHA